MIRRPAAWASSSSAGVIKAPPGWIIVDLHIWMGSNGQCVAFDRDVVPTLTSPPDASSGDAQGDLFVWISSSPDWFHFEGMNPGIKSLAWSGAGIGIQVNAILQPECGC
jgi:hypothetical protein